MAVAPIHPAAPHHGRGLSHWCSPPDEVPPEVSIGEALRAAVHEAPERTAMVMARAGSEDVLDRWSYAELGQEVVRGAAALSARYSPGDRIAIWAPNVAEWVVAYLAAASAGLVTVSLNPALRPKELADALRRSRARCVFTVARYRGTEMAATARAVAPDVPDLDHVVLLEGWADFVAGDRPALPTDPISPSAPAVIQFTSGTTGVPKGAVLSHHALVLDARLFVERLAAPSGAAWFSPSPLFHVGGCGMFVLGVIHLRGTMICTPSFDPEEFLRIVSQEGCAIAGGVPTMLTAILEVEDFSGFDISRLRTICSGAAAQPPELIRRIESALAVDYCALYGLTESSGAVTGVEPSAPLDLKAGTVGRPFPGLEVRICDPVTGATTPVGVAGELCLRGPTVMVEYLDMPEATAAAIDADGWLRTGDLCSMGADGYVRVEGRLKDVIIRGGENIYPKELEDVLHGHPGVAEVAVVGIPDQRLGERVLAFVRRRQGITPVQAEELFSRCREELAPFKTPSEWIFLPELPHSDTGKVLKTELRERFVAGAYQGMSSSGRRTAGGSTDVAV